MIHVGMEHRLPDDQSLAKMLETAEREFHARKASRIASGRRCEARIPCRFGVGRLLVITTMYAMLFAILRALEAHPLDFVAVVLFVTAVGLGQTLLFKGQQPRRSSMIVGACMFAGLIAFSDWTGIGPPRRTLSLRVFPEEAAFIGAGCGYLVGRLIADVFLLINKVGRHRSNSIGADGGQEGGTLPILAQEEKGPSRISGSLGKTYQ